MGGFDPRMSVHGEPADTPEDTEPAKPGALLTSTIWQITSILLIFMVVIGFVAVIPFGPALTITSDPVASRTQVGFVDIDLFGIQIPQVSELVIFIVLIIIMMVSLAVVAGAIGWAFYAMARGVASAQATPHTPLGRQLLEFAPGEAVEAAAPARRTIPAPAAYVLFAIATVCIYYIVFQFIMPAVTSPNALGSIVPFAPDAVWQLSLAIALGVAAAVVRPPNPLMFWAVFAAMAFALYPIFYHVAVGLVYLAFPSIGPITAEFQRVLASLLNAIIIPLLILRPKWFSRFIGRVARLLARFLRWVGTVK
jgi:hypothetical protein